MATKRHSRRTGEPVMPLLHRTIGHRWKIVRRCSNQYGSPGPGCTARNRQQNSLYADWMLSGLYLPLVSRHAKKRLGPRHYQHPLANTSRAPMLTPRPSGCCYRRCYCTIVRALRNQPSPHSLIYGSRPCRIQACSSSCLAWQQTRS